MAVSLLLLQNKQQEVSKSIQRAHAFIDVMDAITNLFMVFGGKLKIMQ